MFQHYLTILGTGDVRHSAIRLCPACSLQSIGSPTENALHSLPLHYHVRCKQVGHIRGRSRSLWWLSGSKSSSIPCWVEAAAPGCYARKHQHAHTAISFSWSIPFTHERALQTRNSGVVHPVTKMNNWSPALPAKRPWEAIDQSDFGSGDSFEGPGTSRRRLCGYVPVSDPMPGIGPDANVQDPSIWPPSRQLHHEYPGDIEQSPLTWFPPNNVSLSQFAHPTQPPEEFWGHPLPGRDEVPVHDRFQGAFDFEPQFTQEANTGWVTFSPTPAFDCSEQVHDSLLTQGSDLEACNTNGCDGSFARGNTTNSTPLNELPAVTCQETTGNGRNDSPGVEDAMRIDPATPPSHGNPLAQGSDLNEIQFDTCFGMVSPDAPLDDINPAAYYFRCCSKACSSERRSLMGNLQRTFYSKSMETSS